MDLIRPNLLSSSLNSSKPPSLLIRWPLKDKETSLFFAGKRVSCCEEYREFFSIIVQRGFCFLSIRSVQIRIHFWWSKVIILFYPETLPEKITFSETLPGKINR